MKSLGKRIIELRDKKSISQKELAEAVNVSQSYLSAVERGKKKASARVIEAIMKKLKISEVEFYKGVSPALVSSINPLSQRSFHSIDVATIAKLETQTKDNAALNQALDILFEFDGVLEEMRDEHKLLFEGIHKLLVNAVYDSTHKRYFETYKREINILIEYSKLVEYIIKTRKSWGNRKRLDDLKDRAIKLEAEYLL